MANKDALDSAGLTWPALVRGRLIKRHQRFLADVRLDDGTKVTAHCPNSGRMTGCSEPNRPVFLSYHDNPRRKLKYTWELIEMPQSLIGVNTLVPNRLVAKAVLYNSPPELSGYDQVQSEVRVNPHTRLDLKLSAKGRRDCYVEIKNCTLVENAIAQFPDAPTTRGQKHLICLEALKADGHRAVIFFLVQRTDAIGFCPADSVDALYGRQLRRVVSKGVEILVYDVNLNLEGISLGKSLPLHY